MRQRTAPTPRRHTHRTGLSRRGRVQPTQPPHSGRSPAPTAARQLPVRACRPGLCWCGQACVLSTRLWGPMPNVQAYGI